MKEFEATFDVEVDEKETSPSSEASIQVEEELVVKKTTKERIQELQDIRVSIIEKEMLEQAKMGVYDNNLLKQVESLAKEYDVGLSGEAKNKILDAKSKIIENSRKRIDSHVKEAQENTQKAMKMQ